MESNNLLAKENLQQDFLDSHSYKKKLVQKQLRMFWIENPVFQQLLQQNSDIETIRKRVFNYLADYEKKTLNNQFYLNVLDRNIARKCINVLKNIFSRRSEELTKFSALYTLFQLAHNVELDVSLGFVEELRCLFIGLKGNTGLSGKVFSIKHMDKGDHRLAANIRSETLNLIAGQIHEKMESYVSGLEEEVIRRREENRDRILKFFGGSSQDWYDWKWHLRHVIRDAETLSSLIKLTPREKKAIERAKENRLPFGITPYYLSLMDYEPGRDLDHAVRAQVIPPLDYVENVLLSKELGVDLDFMGEKDTSPIDLITRRYPMIAIFKPYNTCAQICVYCQRNWEIDDVLAKEAESPKSKLEQALDWCENNKTLTEILVTGGDPGIMNDKIMERILTRLAQMKHIRRIRIGTRVPVVLPMRIDEKYADLLAKFKEPGKREIVVVTHFEHQYEVTPECTKAVQLLRSKGIPVYNQTVFTMENARRFEMVSLRQLLRRIGVDPYYTFNTKGKEETKAYRVPIARLVQEQAEEARLSPGLDRTDEAVFNIPRIGKSYLRAGQDHDVIMVMQDGSRVYEFYPWDQNYTDTDSYLYTDVPIVDFLLEMNKRGENPDDYKSIWYYF